MSALSFTREKGTAAFHAKTLLHELSLKTPPIRPREIVKRLEVLLQEVDAADRFDGWILQVDGAAAICINRAIASEPRKSFTIAHELGHFRLSWHNRQPQCLRQDIEALHSLKTEEAEANEFAAELLMPEDMVRPMAEQGEIGFARIQEIADRFETSFTSSAYRYIRHTPYLAALVICEQRRIKNVQLSAELFSTKRRFAERGTPLSSNCLAIDLFDAAGHVTKSSTNSDSVLPSVWFPETEDTAVRCYEETRGLPAIDQSVSLIWIEEVEPFVLDDEDNDIE